MSDTREGMAQRVAALLEDGWNVNLGIGMPMLVAQHLGNKDVLLHSENGLLGVGIAPKEDQVDPDLIDAGKRTVTEAAGASYFSSSMSFAMIRGGHLDATVLGAYQVSEGRDIASWAIPDRAPVGMGGAMDLVAGSKRVIVMMPISTKTGEPKIVDRCTYPLTGHGCVDVIVTDLATFAFEGNALYLQELMPGHTEDELHEKMSCPFWTKVKH